MEVVEQAVIDDIDPQPGSQQTFLDTEADIAVYGGAAGAGKSYALLMEPLRHDDKGLFGAVIFRRTYPQITNEGGLWDTSMKIYPPCGATPKYSGLEWRFPSGARVKFAHMQHETDRFNWDGAQIPLIGFDQLEHFTWRQYSYMLARNRSTCGVHPYIRATCNPDPDHWLRSFMAWWIDEDTGLPIMKRSGIVRWFVIIEEHVHWADTPQEIKKQFGQDALPKSFTFIPGNVYDNKILLDQNPEYLANLKALYRVDRERLLLGNWNTRETAGMYFKRDYFEIVEAAPALVKVFRYWDRAATATETGKEHTASWTAGVLMGIDARGVFYIADIVRFQGTPGTIEKTLPNIASQDTKAVSPALERDPGQAGVADARTLARLLSGYDVRINPVRESKGVRARPLSAQAEAGNVKLVRGPWNEAFLREAEAFDGSKRCVSDQIDGASGALYMLTKSKRAGTWGRAR